MRFSQRRGLTPATKQLQIQSIDMETRNGLWNAVILFVLEVLHDNYRQWNHQGYSKFIKALWHHYFKLPIDTISPNHYENDQFIRSKFFAFEWYQVYDFLEFVVNLDQVDLRVQFEPFIKFCNQVLEREFSAFRFINYAIAPISNTHEISQIEEALNSTRAFTFLKGANIHLTAALFKLSDREHPDYRNSIKESVSAIESVVKLIAGTPKESLGPALEKLKSTIALHGALEKGFKNIYGYTSDGDGIRHGLMDDPNCDFGDAKFMLVSSSAFINYLIAKAQKAGLQIR